MTISFKDQGNGTRTILDDGAPNPLLIDAQAAKTLKLYRYLTKWFEDHIAGKSPPSYKSGSPPVFGTPPFGFSSLMTMNNGGPHGYALNTGIWTGDDLDLTPILLPSRGFLISPRDAIMAHHHLPANGNDEWAPIYLLGDETMTVAAHSECSPTQVEVGDIEHNSDIEVVTFTEDVPVGIGFCKILPADYRSLLGGDESPILFPTLFTNQDFVLLIGGITGISGAGSYLDPSPKYGDWFYPIRGNDSGSGHFFPINGELVGLCTVHGATTSDLSQFVTTTNGINARMAANGSPYEVTIADLSAFADG